MSFKLTESTKQKVQTALEEMVKGDLDIFELPDTNGMVLVKAQSSAEEARKQDGNQIAEYQVGAVRYILCNA